MLFLPFVLASLGRTGLFVTRSDAHLGGPARVTFTRVTPHSGGVSSLKVALPGSPEPGGGAPFVSAKHLSFPSARSPVTASVLGTGRLPQQPGGKGSSPRPWLTSRREACVGLDVNGTPTRTALPRARGRSHPALSPLPATFRLRSGHRCSPSAPVPVTAT